MTGGGRGIGAVVARAFAESGARVAIAARTRSEIDAVADALCRSGAEALAVVADVADERQVRALVQEVTATFGGLDVLVNAAGISPFYKRAETLELSEWRQVIDVNLTGTFLCCRESASALAASGTGRVVNVVSIGAQVGLERLAAYCASKAGIEGLTRVLALEWAKRGVSVNCVGPGFIATEFTAGLLANPSLNEMLVSRTPMGRLGEPGDVLGAILFLASEEARYVTGQTLYVDGGWLAQ